MVHDEQFNVQSGQVPALLFRYEAETFTHQLTIYDNCYWVPCSGVEQLR